ncbi:CpaF family protein [Desulfoscipio geothermicus]|uniref:Pilus assembly protein CpaF n=1 Tax=Desulfoscipio geothermicus DSM 3669 TaxID=1121426 RepID=A0A1I6E1W3_9FIRM|nr:ATPase, T2SS/T4P/T4SS family [Desulfoscipio geothermicus]SFR11764.1 pilus assembly protein CpaF [Desulfoscipio geothermicus DSM 3669]
MGAAVDLKEEVYRRKRGRENKCIESVAPGHTEQVDNIIQTITQKITTDYGDLVNQVSRGEKEVQVLENVVEKTIVDLGAGLGRACSTRETVTKVMDSILGYGILQPYINDPEITDIFVNGPDNVYKRVKGEDIFIPEVHWKNNNHLEQYIRSVLVRCGRKIHSGIPLVDARDVKNKLRINAGISPVAKIPYITFRKHTVYNFTLEDFLQNGTFTQEVLDFQQKAVEARLNLLIAGPTGSGKTTLLRFLAEQFIPPNQRVVVLEEEEELMLRLHNLVALEAKKKSGEEDTSVEMEDMVRNALRMAMRRIILGELRGKEAFTLLRAFGTGHDGGLTTIHANDTYNAIEQLAVMMMYANQPLSYTQLKRIISQSVDLIIYIENYRVVEVTSVDGFDENKNDVILNPVFVTERAEDGRLNCRFCSISSNLRKLFWQRGVKI